MEFYKAIRGQVQWPVIPELWEARAEGMFEARSLRLVGKHSETPYLPKKIRQAWWCIPVL